MTRVALVTGGARGLGAACARQLADGGWSVVVADVCADDPVLGYSLATKEDLDLVLRECGGRAEGVLCDVRVQADVEAAVRRAVERFGGLDAVVACAGVIAGGPPAWEADELVWRTMLDVNLTGVWRLASAAIPAMLARRTPRRARFVAVSSVAGLRGLRGLAAYGAAKHGVIGLVRGLAADLAEHGISANAVCPGAMSTEMLAATARLYDLDDPQLFAEHHLVHRLLRPEEVARLVVWLCSEESEGVTGAVLPFDAGMSS